jgi:hypothetical protein
MDRRAIVPRASDAADAVPEEGVLDRVSGSCGARSCSRNAIRDVAVGIRTDACPVTAASHARVATIGRAQFMQAMIRRRRVRIPCIRERGS